MTTIQDFDVEILKPVSECNADELEHATDEGVWLWWGTVEAESEADAIQMVQDQTGKRARIAQES